MMIETAPRRRRSDLIIGGAAPIKKVLDQIGAATITTLPVFLLGESGTGKELVARTIHATGSRADGPFLSTVASSLTCPRSCSIPEDNPFARFTWRGARGGGQRDDFLDRGIDPQLSRGCFRCSRAWSPAPRALRPP
jgi:hypothetical protein